MGGGSEKKILEVFHVIEFKAVGVELFKHCTVYTQAKVTLAVILHACMNKTIIVRLHIEIFSHSPAIRFFNIL